MTIVPERLAALDTLTLDHGSHGSFEEGHCAMEVVAWLADQGHTHAPECASPIIARYTIALNDRWDDAKRQALKPYLPRMVGTGSDGLDDTRKAVAMRALLVDLLPPWLRLAGLDDHAEKLPILVDSGEQVRAVRAARDAAYTKRHENQARLAEKIRRHLPADTVAAAVAVAVAAAFADTVAAAAAVAVAAAFADTVTAAVAVAAAAAVAAAVADAAFADVAAAAAAAVFADAAFAVAAGRGTYTAAYKAARAHFHNNALPIPQTIRDLATEQDAYALTLLDQLINPPTGGDQ